MKILNTEDILQNIFNYFEEYNSIYRLRLVSSYFKDNIQDKFNNTKCRFCFINFRQNYEISKTLQNIKDKLYLANMFGDEDYAIMNTDNLKMFNKSIGWGINSHCDDCWKDCFSFNYIIWTHEEKEFIYDHYGISIL